MGVAPQLQPLAGMLLRRSTDIYPKELARDMRAFFNSLLGVSVQICFGRQSEIRWQIHSVSFLTDVFGKRSGQPH